MIILLTCVLIFMLDLLPKCLSRRSSLCKIISLGFPSSRIHTYFYIHAHTYRTLNHFKAGAAHSVYNSFVISSKSHSKEFPYSTIYLSLSRYYLFLNRSRISISLIIASTTLVHFIASAPGRVFHLQVVRRRWGRCNHHHSP